MSNVYPHMCRDEHIEIGHSDSESELCPMCVVLAESKRREMEKQMDHLSCDQEISKQRALVAHLSASTTNLLARAENAEARVKTLEDKLQDLLDETDLDYSSPVVKAAHRALAAKGPK